MRISRRAFSKRLASSAIFVARAAIANGQALAMIYPGR
jgi:hypothetical protein